jgi:hypothetical protein
MNEQKQKAYDLAVEAWEVLRNIEPEWVEGSPIRMARELLLDALELIEKQ